MRDGIWAKAGNAVHRGVVNREETVTRGLYDCDISSEVLDDLPGRTKPVVESHYAFIRDDLHSVMVRLEYIHA